MSGYYHKCQVLTNVEIIMFYYESEVFFFFLISEVGVQTYIDIQEGSLKITHSIA